MNNRELNQRDAIIGGFQFLQDHPFTPPNPRVTVLETSLGNVIDEVNTFITNQVSGRGFSSGGVGSCKSIAQDLRGLMRQAAEIGKALDPVVFPGVKEQLRMPRNSYPQLEAHARTFLEVLAVPAVKQAMIDRMMAVDFDETLGGLLDDFIAARARKLTGKSEQMTGTAGISETIKRGMSVVRELDAILRAAYRQSPALYTAWKGAVRVRRSAAASPVIVPSASGAGAPAS